MIHVTLGYANRVKLATLSMGLMSLLVFMSNAAYGQTPAITKVELGVAVNSSCYAVTFSSSMNGDGVWVNPDATSGDSTTNPSGPAGLAGLKGAPATMFGTDAGYCNLLFSASSDATQLMAEMAAINTNMPTNVNTAMLGARGPVNKTNVELSRAIPAGTSATFTIDMAGLPPHVVAVMGGTAPTITYDAAGTGTLTVRTTTTGTTSNAGDAFTSVVGVLIYTNSVVGSTPLRIATQTNSWMGDIFPLLPGVDSHAAVSGNGGTMGSITAKCGLTIYGITGQSRDINVFIPLENLELIFSSGITEKNIDAFVDTTAVDSTSPPDYINFGMIGHLAEFNYTFASPKDAAMGVDPDSFAQLTMTVAPENSGTTDPAVGTSTVNTNEDVAIIATAANGYTFSSWANTENATIADPYSASTTAVLTRDATITAIFVPNSKIVTLVTSASPETGGTVSPTSVTLAEGGIVEITAMPATGQNFVRWEVAEGNITLATATDATTTATVNTNGGLKAFFSSSSSGGDLAVTKLKIGMTINYPVSDDDSKATEDTGSMKDSLGITATLPNDFDLSDLESDDLKIMIDEWIIPIDDVEMVKEDKYILSSSGKTPSVKITVQDKKGVKTMVIKASKASLTSYINGVDGVYVWLNANSNYYSVNADVDEKTTWKYKGDKGSTVTTFSGTYVKEGGTVAKTNKFSAKGDGLEKPTDEDFNFDEVTPYFKASKTEWSTAIGSDTDVWKTKGDKHTYKSAKGHDPSVKMNLDFTKKRWSFAVSKTDEGSNVSRNGNIKITVGLPSATTEWEVIDTTIGTDNPVNQKTVLTLSE